MAENPMDALLRALMEGSGPRGTMFMGRHVGQMAPGETPDPEQLVRRAAVDSPDAEGMGASEVLRNVGGAGIAMQAPRFSPHAPGGTPKSRDIALRGFKREMTPEEFRGAAYPLPTEGYSRPSIEYQLGRVVEGEPIGQPMLNVRWLPEEGKWGVVGHEGRHRNMMLEENFPGIKTNIDVFPQGMSAKDVTPEMRAAGLVNEWDMRKRQAKSEWMSSPSPITNSGLTPVEYKMLPAAGGKAMVVTVYKDSEGNLIRQPFGKAMEIEKADKLAKEMNRALADRLAR